jgi:catechol 2,3-dioxygenase-like lactoylglutathione lyase family enzyme
MAIYRATGPVPASVGRRVDHIAFAVNDLDAARAFVADRALRVVGKGRLEAMETVTIEGPDGLAIELVGPRDR